MLPVHSFFDELEKIAEARVAWKIPKKDISIGGRGMVHFGNIMADGKDVGSISYHEHPEGHAEVRHIDVDSEHQGKGYGQDALREVFNRHGALLSDTRGGTTRMAQRAMQKLVSKTPGSEIIDLRAKDLGGGDYADMEGDPTSIWYVRGPGSKNLSQEDLSNIEHNSKYHRRRQGRAINGALMGGAIGGSLGGAAADRYLKTLPGFYGGAAGGALLGGYLGGKGVSKLQHLWDKKHNLRGDW